MAIVKRASITVEEITISLSIQDAVVLKKFMGLISDSLVGPQRVASSIYDGLTKAGINYSSINRLELSDIKIGV